MSFKKSVGWADFSINPIKGLCKSECWYCWNQALYKRKFLTPEIRLDLTVFDHLPKKPQKIFLCSTHDLFGDWISKTWRDLIFANIPYYPQHTFQILTKFPQNIDREMPDNVWLGVSITRPSEMKRWTNLYFHQRANLKFVSFEPLLERLDCYPSGPDWIIIGKLTGYGHKHDPDIAWINDIVKDCTNQGTKVFLKNNLKDIWGENLIQEFPE